MYINSKKWTAFASSVQGYAHKKTNLINQDSFYYHLDIDNNIFVAILSDGAGSAVNSKIGSSICCYNIGQDIKKLGLDLCKNRYIDNEEVGQGIKDIIKKHLDSFNAFDAPIKTFHHTLSAVLITPFGGVIIRVGDSPIVVVTHHDFHQNQGFSAELLAKNTVFDEDKLQGYANQTTFLTSPKWESSIEIDRLPENAIAVFLMSDGAGSLFISNNKLFVPSIDELFSRLNKNTSEPHEVLQDFLNLPEANEITGDDKTFIGFVPDVWLHSKGKKKNFAHNFLTEAAVRSLLVTDSSTLDVNGGKKNDATPFKLENNDFLSLSETSKVESGRPEAQTQQNQAVKPTENNFSKMVQHRNTSLLNTKQNTTQQNNPKETTTLELMAPVNAPVLGSLKKSFLDKNKNVILVFILLFSIILAGSGGYFYHKFQSQEALATTDAAKSEKATTGAATTGVVKSVAAKSDKATTGAATTGAAKSEKATTGAATTGVVKSGAAKSEKATTGAATTGVVKSVAAKSDKATTGAATTGVVKSVAAKSDKATTGAATTGAAKSEKATTGAATTGAATTGVVKSGAAKSGAAKSGAVKSEKATTGAATTGVVKSGAAKSEKATTGAATKGVAKSGAATTDTAKSEKATTGAATTDTATTDTATTGVAKSGAATTDTAKSDAATTDTAKSDKATTVNP